MSSQVAICNQALSQVGANPIISLLDDTAGARQCALHYDPIRRAVLQAYVWSHALKRGTNPAPLAQAPEYGWDYAYSLPADSLRIVWVGEMVSEPIVERPTPYTVEDGKILINFGLGIAYRYVYDHQNPAEYPALFEQAFVARLAAEFAIPLAESKTLRQQSMQLYMAKIEEARNMDAMQGVNQQTHLTTLTRARWTRGQWGAPAWV